MLKTVPVHELQEQLAADPRTVLIDVRTAAEFAIVHVRGARNVPLGTMSPAHVAAEWGRESEGKSIFVICQSGVRSQRFVEDLSKCGFHGAVCVAGGTIAWQAAGLPVERKVVRQPVLSIERQSRIVLGAGIVAACFLGYGLHPDFFAVAGALGASLLVSGVSGGSVVSTLLAKMPWNR